MCASVVKTVEIRYICNMKDENGQKAGFSWYRIVLPIVIGLLVMWWIFADQLSEINFSNLKVTQQGWIGIGLALLCVFGREAGFVCRYRWISNGDLKWSQAFKVCMMTEFASAVTPSSAGGSSISMIFMNRYGIALGRGTTLMLSTLLFDTAFYVLACPLTLLLVPWHEIVAPLELDYGIDTTVLICLLYSLMAVWLVVLFIGIVVWPHWIKKVLGAIFSLPFLKRWSGWANHFGDNMLEASVELKNYGVSWWLKCMGATIMSWLSRYLMMNALIFGFLPGADHLLVFARQAVVWLVLVFCPTPGGSGLSEWLFNGLYGDVIASASLAFVLALIWRLLSYYIFLLAGAVVAPLWLKGDEKENNETRRYEK